MQCLSFLQPYPSPLLFSMLCNTLWLPVVISHMMIIPLSLFSSPVYFLSYSISHPYFRDLHPFHTHLHHCFSILPQPLSFLIPLLGTFLSFIFLFFLLSMPCVLGQIARTMFQPVQSCSQWHGVWGTSVFEHLLTLPGVLLRSENHWQICWFWINFLILLRYD